MEPLGDKVRLLTLTNLPKGPLVTSFYGCKNMRTLTILESKITAISLGTNAKMKCLRTLNLTGSVLNELPEQIDELIHLRYMNLSRNQALKELPNAVCDLCNLQTLDVRWCLSLEKLPKAMRKLINLKHLYIVGCYELKYIPKGIQNLKSLQVLDYFYGCESDDDEALKLEDLGMMDQLQGSLSIERFGNKDDDVIEIAKAQLGNKEHLSELRVFFQGGSQRKGDEERLKALEPHQNLESLWIWDCHIGNADSLYWVKSLHNLRRVDLRDWRFREVLPPLGKLPSLEVLDIKWMEIVKTVGVEFLGIEEVEEVSAGILFPKLKRLSFYDMGSWEEWEGISKDSCEITIMPRLSFLQIGKCPRLKALPDFLYKIATLRTLEIKDCQTLKGEYEKGVGKEWHKISHIPNLTITRWGTQQQIIFPCTTMCFISLFGVLLRTASDKCYCCQVSC